MFYFIFALIFCGSSYSAYKINELPDMYKPMWALEGNGALFFSINGLISGFFFIGMSIYGIIVEGILIVLLCTFIIYPIVINILRMVFGDAFLTYLSVPAYIILLFMM